MWGRFFCVLSFSGVPSHFRGMVTHRFTQSEPVSRRVASEARTILNKLLRVQHQTLTQDYVRRTGQLASALNAGIYTISDTDDSLDIRIRYPSTMRLLDLKKTRYGKKKKYYTAIYNRNLYGHMLGKGYSLSTVMNLAIHHDVSGFFEDLHTAFKELDL